MRFDRAVWKSEFYFAFPDWPCPSCKGGTLHSKDEAKWLTFETAASRRTRSQASGIDAEYSERRASGFLECDRCAEPVAFLAIVENLPSLPPRYKPLHLMPAPAMLEIPEDASAEVRDGLRRAFALYWFDPSSSGNAIRTAIEALLDQAKIPRGRNDAQKHRRVPLSLHTRLQLYEKREPALGTPLMALKWLGNSGTHERLLHSDMLDAFELLDHTLAEIYRKHTKRIMRTAKAINRNKGPLKRKVKGGYGGSYGSTES